MFNDLSAQEKKYLKFLYFNTGGAMLFTFVMFFAIGIDIYDNLSELFRDTISVSCMVGLIMGTAALIVVYQDINTGKKAK